MKLFYLLLMLMISSVVFAGNSIPFDKYEEATIHFHDGTSIRGFGKITVTSRIKFKTTEDGEPDTWTELMLKGITLHRELVDIDFLYIKVDRRKTLRLLEVIELGEISIFAEASSTLLPFTVYFNVGGLGSPDILSNNLLGVPNSYDQEVSFDIYAKKENEEAINFTTVFKFKKVATKFFKNCPQIVDRLQDRKYKRGDIIEMVYYYNDYCAALD
ncbi:hypothetical protein [Psychroserpens sp. Hel_I_66]|uniref:hypothetical protein n=1 Tax=Psychroserpens sp. Hel_I_66 TaxID=1250004 RepID=UPI0006469638|nr:hypothetical protein [Psychroserpens sp. Hel_I_66]